MESVALKVSEVWKHYGGHCAVQGVSFTAHKGDVVGLLGRNGAGKTSLCKTIAGVLPVSSGQIHIAGYDIQEEPIQAKQHIGYLPEHPPLYSDLTLYEYLHFTAALKRIPKKTRNTALEQVLAYTNLEDTQKALIKTLSKGYQQRVGIAQALLGSPDVLVLDEPTSGLDPHQIDDFRKLIQRLQPTCAVVLSSHILQEVVSTCSHVLVMHEGRICASHPLRSNTHNTAELETLFLSATEAQHGFPHADHRA